MSDFTPFKLRLSNRLNEDILDIADTLMNRLSMLLCESIRAQIDTAGNGTSDMQNTAKRYVKEISRKRTSTGIELMCGVDPSFANDERDFVRISVVLFGNQAGGPLHEKPGVDTWNKGVVAKGKPDPDNRNADNMLPDGFNQYPRVEWIMENVMEYDMKKHIEDYLNSLIAAINKLDFSNYLEVG